MDILPSLLANTGTLITVIVPGIVSLYLLRLIWSKRKEFFTFGFIRDLLAKKAVRWVLLVALTIITLDVLLPLLSNVLTLVPVLLLGLLSLYTYKLYIIYRKDIYKNRLVQNVLARKASVWVQRLFITFTLVMLFFNFFATGVAATDQTATNQPSSPVSAKVTANNNNKNANLYKGLYAQLVQHLQSNDKQYLSSFKDIEALGKILSDINTTVGGVDGYQLTAKVPVFDKLYTDVLNYIFEQRDVNATKFFFNSTSNTIFVAEALNYFGLLDMPLLNVTARLGKNATSDYIFNQFSGKTLKDVFRQSLLLEFQDHPPAIAPINEKYEPALSHAISLGILKLSDLGLPDGGITYQDYLNGQKPAIEIHNINSGVKNNITFKSLTNSSYTVSGTNSVNIILPTFSGSFNLEYKNKHNIQYQLIM